MATRRYDRVHKATVVTEALARTLALVTALTSGCGGGAEPAGASSTTPTRVTPLDYSNTTCVEAALASSDAYEQVRCLLRAGDTDNLFAALGLHDALEQKIRALQDRIGEPAVEAIVAEIDRSFANEQLQQAFEQRIVAEHNAEHARTLLSYYATEPGRRYAATSASEPDVEELSEWAQTDLPASRQPLIARLRIATQIPELASALVAVPMRGITQALLPLAPPGSEAPTPEQLQEAITPTLQGVDSAMTMTFAFLLRDWSDADVEAIASFEETPAAQWFNSARTSALSAVMAEAYQRLGTAIATHVPTAAAASAPAAVDTVVGATQPTSAR